MAPFPLCFCELSCFNTIVIQSVIYGGDREIVYRVYEDGMIMYYYRRSRKEEQVVAVPREEDRIKGVQGKLGTIWDKHGDTILLVGAVGIACVAAIVSVCSGGSLAPGALAALLIMLMLDGAMPEPKRNNCIEA